MTSGFDYTYIEPLTQREIEVLQGLADGLSNKEIADALVVEVNTVKWYNAQIYDKLGVKNRRQAVARAQTLGILELDSDDPLQRLQHNLPADTLPFIGRAQEIRELVQQMTSDNIRLITILGPGGMGKTRLSIEVGRRLLAYFVDGVYFVPLATIASAESMVTMIAETIDFKFHSDTQPMQQLLAHLREQRLLLIMDNFEHLLDHAGLLTDLLKAAPSVKVLVTSREKLGLGGEVVHVISGLLTPYAKGTDIIAHDAVKLFVEAANRTTSQVDEDSMSVIANICQMLGGMPLAILLAAAWMDTLSLSQIEAEIKSGLDILAATFRDSPPRHQSIEAVFDTSWQRLTIDEQTVFMRLSVFRDGFTREAAQEVAGANIRNLQRLVHTSFIQHLSSGRYTIHELMRQYSEVKLVESGELEATREKHAMYFAEFITPLGQTPWGMATRDVLEPISADFENVRAAWNFQGSRQNISELRRFLDGMWLFLDATNRSQEGIGMLEPLLTAYPASNADNRLFRGQLLARLSWYHNDIGQPQKALKFAEQSLEITQEFEANDDILLVYCLYNIHSWSEGRRQESIEYAERDFQLASTHPHSKWYLHFALSRHSAYLEAGRYAEALDWVESLPEYTWQVFVRAGILMQMGKYHQAEALLLDGLNKYWLSPIHYIGWYSKLATCALQAGNNEKAWQYVQRGLQYGVEGSREWGTFEPLSIVLDLLIIEEQLFPAVELLSLMVHYFTNSEFTYNQLAPYKDILENKLPADVFETAWERGKELDLGDVISEYIER